MPLSTSLVKEKIFLLADWAQDTARSTLQTMLSEASQPGILSLALGLPATELFPTEAYARAAAEVLATDERALQYGPPLQRLKSHIVELMMSRGVACNEDQVFLTTGAQQGLSLLTRLLLNQGGTVLTEDLVYPAFQQVLEPYHSNILQVPTSLDTGIDVDAVEALLKQNERPAFIYTVPNGHNPLGVSISPAKRIRLVELAEQYAVPIVEDDPYGFIYYDRLPAQPLRALSDRWAIHVGSFSKILAPSLRAGWIIAPESLIPKLSIIKEASDLDTSTFSQRIVSTYIESGQLTGHLSMLRREYGARRDAMLHALRENFPAHARWSEPNAGFFVWVELPKGIDTGELLRIAIGQERVAFIPGHAFNLNGARHSTNCMRLNFSHCQPALIAEAVGRIAKLLKAVRA